MPHVYSTLANDNTYNLYDTSGSNAQTPVLLNSVKITGGAGIATKHLLTPLGILTTISDEELEFLKTNEVFQTHVNNGYITYHKAKVDVEVAAADMNTRDVSAPIVPEDTNMDDETVPKPIIGSIKKK